ncbi:MAG: alpha-amylase family glycosyl hydrolase [Pseudomonadota bacterium]
MSAPRLRRPRTDLLLLPLLMLLITGCPDSSPKGWDYHTGDEDTGGPTPLDVRAELGPIPDVHRQGDADTAIPTDLSPPPDPGGPDLAQPVPWRDCTQHLSLDAPDEASVALAGEFTGWAEAELPMEDPDGDGTWELEIDASTLVPGSYGYKFHTGSDLWLLDPSNPLAKWVDGTENSKLVVPDCAVPELQVLDLDVDPAAGTVHVVVLALDTEAGVRPDTAAVLLDGEPLQSFSFNPVTNRFDVTLFGRPRGTKVTLRFHIANTTGPAEELTLPIWVEDEGEWSWRDAVMYFAFTDRFADGADDHDEPLPCAPDHLANWKAGDWPGITQKIEEGYFDDLGVNVLWISPPYNNPEECMDGDVAGEQYTAYHGYFPVSLTEPEERFGTMDDLRALTAAAHARGIRVIADLVANHVYWSAAVYQEHQGSGWFHEVTPCAPAWDKPIECWFQPYMPDWDHTVDPVVELVTDAALHWAREADLDGFRVDAVKHMVHNFSRTLRWKLDRAFAHGTHRFYLVGETFMGEWGGGGGFAETVIKEYVNPWELDGQFDFPMYWALLESTGRDEADFNDLAQFLTESDGYYGPDSLMCSFIGNHDVPRFTSHAAGQIGDLWGNGSKDQGWNDPPAQPTEESAYLRTGLAFGLMMTLPEIPLIYYGDEIGLAGAGDPDNRRVMPWDDLNGEQETLRTYVQVLGALRRDLPPLRRGDLTVIASAPDLLIFERQYAGDTVIVAASRSPVDVQVEIPAGTLGDAVVEHISGGEFDVTDGHVVVNLPAYGIAVLTAAP